MVYPILGVHITVIHYTTRDAYQVYVAWAFNQPDQAFCWRCTEMGLDVFPTWQDIQRKVVARGSDVRDIELVKTFFGNLPITKLVD